LQSFIHIAPQNPKTPKPLQHFDCNMKDINDL